MFDVCGMLCVNEIVSYVLGQKGGSEKIKVQFPVWGSAGSESILCPVGTGVIGYLIKKCLLFRSE